MEISINSLPTDIHEISTTEYNQMQLNAVTIKYKKVRQESKAPTFALT